MTDTPENLEEVKAEAGEANEVSEDGNAEVVDLHEKDSKESDDEISKEMKELLEYKDKFYYVAAEMENMKKRHERDMQSQIKYGNEKVLKGLLEVVDNFRVRYN